MLNKIVDFATARERLNLKLNFKDKVRVLEAVEIEKLTRQQKLVRAYAQRRDKHG